MEKAIYQRILLKLSGEAFQGNQGIDPAKLVTISQEIANIVKLGVQVAIVMGGGNFIRGSMTADIDRVTADQMGMLATVINGLALRDAFQRHSIPVEVMSALAVPGLVDFYNCDKAKFALANGKVVIFVGGTGNPLVTTDTAAALRGIEVKANIILKATKVDGVFAADPLKNPQAKSFSSLDYEDVLTKRLAIMDLSAILLCQEHHLPIRVFNMSQPGALLQIVRGEQIGTLIKSGD